MGRLLTVAYDGTRYCGFQFQINGLTVQEVLEDALGAIEKRSLRVKGASRTDSGVHAIGQRVFFISSRDLPDKAYLMGCNALLPPDVAVLGVSRVPEDFNPRLTAGKIYRYTVRSAPVRDPLHVNSQWTVYRRLDVEAMRRAARQLVGTHDFSAFQAADCERENAVRTVLRLEIQQRGEHIDFLVAGTAFLKNMVRIMVGTLVDVGTGRFSPDEVSGILQGRDRTAAGQTAPAAGLCLMNVFYPGDAQCACLREGPWPDWNHETT
ncbi:MAG: tRNA pseudouridine(38-40) synthase TruA [Deltaproteobacteria bacterium HGW-Deltaproteobacteria-17]|nr:MAG: tRNA pseudouridine(38-40) synthase TruA [Deltaproteobacteria bacterium HGW-Deltaproteobacteria-17]